MLKKELKEFRLNKGYTQKRMAEEIGITIQTYNKIENGFKRMTIETINKISKATGLSVEYIRKHL